MIIEDLNTSNQLNLIDISVIHHPTNAQHVFFSSTTVAIDNILDKNTNQNQFKSGKPDEVYPLTIAKLNKKTITVIYQENSPNNWK